MKKTLCLLVFSALLSPAAYAQSLRDAFRKVSPSVVVIRTLEQDLSPDLADGFGNLDEGDINLPGDRYRGVSLRTYDPEANQWSIYWLDSRFPGRLTPPVKGALDVNRVFIGK